MPGWHAKTQELQASGELRVAGIAVEQHGDRTQLFLQWKQLNWPVMIDPLNLLEMTAVPVTVLIDEFGVVRKINPDEGDLREFLATKSERPASLADTEAPQPRVSPAMAYAISTVTGNKPGQLGEAIRRMEKELLTSPTDALAQFRLGVLFRLRHDSLYRRTHDFGRAIEHWSKALALDPNQYIWRRRIQQYGPRLDKPYPFYDWVAMARDEIRARGERPLLLQVEPRGAEIARPGLNEEPVRTTPPVEHPDPHGRLARDEGLIRIETTVVPSTDPRSRGYRVHVELSPSQTRKAHWNNEAGPLSLWLTHHRNWEFNANPVIQALPKALATTSNESRHLEFEVTSALAASEESTTVTGQLFYYVCEGDDGACLFLKQDLWISFPP